MQDFFSNEVRVVQCAEAEYSGARGPSAKRAVQNGSACKGVEGA